MRFSLSCFFFTILSTNWDKWPPYAEEVKHIYGNVTVSGFRETGAFMKWESTLMICNRGKRYWSDYLEGWLEVWLRQTPVPCATCVYRLSLWKIYMIELNFDYYKMQDILMSSKSPFLTLKFNFHALLSFKDAFCNIIFCKVIDMFLVNRTSLANLELMLPPKLIKKMASSIKIFLILYWTEKLQFIQKVIVSNHTLDFHEMVLMYELLIEVSTISQSFYFFIFSFTL